MVVAMVTVVTIIVVSVAGILHGCIQSQATKYACGDVASI